MSSACSELLEGRPMKWCRRGQTNLRFIHQGAIEVSRHSLTVSCLCLALIAAIRGFAVGSGAAARRTAPRNRALLRELDKTIRFLRRQASTDRCSSSPRTRCLADRTCHLWDRVRKRFGNPLTAAQERLGWLGRRPARDWPGFARPEFCFATFILFAEARPARS